MNRVGGFFFNAKPPETTANDLRTSWLT